MVLFIISIISFNAMLFKVRKHLSKNQIVHIWMFSMIFETLFDIFVDEKTNGYWYFMKGIDWTNLIIYILLIPPICVLFLNGFPFNRSWFIKIRYYIYWVVFCLAYECLALLPPPWGYFHYGWWKLLYSVVLDPILLIILINYYKWICKIERSH